MTHFTSIGTSIGDAKRKRSGKPHFYWEIEGFADSEWKRRALHVRYIADVPGPASQRLDGLDFLTTKYTNHTKRSFGQD
jgi:hypothetical protein